MAKVAEYEFSIQRKFIYCSLMLSMLLFYSCIGIEARKAKMEHGTGLYVMDISPQVLRFSIINRELFRAKNLNIYKKLRFESDFDSWQRLQKGHEVEHLLSKDDFLWWQNQVRGIDDKNRYGLFKILDPYESHIIHHKYLKFHHTFKKLFTKLGPKEEQKIVTMILYEPLDKIEKRMDDTSIKLSFSLNELKVWRKRVKSEYGNYLFDERLYNRLHLAAVNREIFIDLDHLPPYFSTWQSSP